eukprot:5600219-Karenia_brevis.AAC.1
MKDRTHRSIICEEYQHQPCEACGAKIMEPPNPRATQKRKYCAACCLWWKNLTQLAHFLPQATVGAN